MRRTISGTSIAGAIGLVGLGALGGAYVLTRAPAPSVRVLWERDVPAARRAELERTYLLLNPRAPSPSLAYDLLDTSRRNIEALVTDPAVDDTNDIDRVRFEIRSGTAPGNEEMWIAHRTPGLREPWVRWSIVAVLAVLAIAGFGRRFAAWVGSRVRRIFASRAGTGDVFDRHDARDVSAALPVGDTPGLAVKLLVTALLVLAVGVPVLDTWKAWLLGAGWLALVFSRSRVSWWRAGVAVALVAVVVGVKAWLPHADLAEAHNPFLVTGEGQALQQQLPPAIFASWKAQLDALYPADPARDKEPYQWRTSPVPKALFTRSADAIWRPAKYTRQVDAIGFRTLGEFRGAFANEPAYNFWLGALRREAMPFYVMYELTPASVGSRLAWAGQVFWERDGGTFDEVTHAQEASREITSRDVGRRVYAAFFPERDARRAFSLERSPALRMARWSDALLTIVACAGALWLTLRVRRGAFARALLLVVLGSLAIHSYLPGRAEYLGGTYPPQSGGDDGVVHDGMGRGMAMLAAGGGVEQALEGFEPVYWFTPGMRYVRMAEKLVFGDTNHLVLLLLVAMPVVVFYLMRHLTGATWAWATTVLFCVMPAGSFSFLQYVGFAKAGYGEAVGVGLFLLGLGLMLGYPPRRGGGSLASIWVAGAALAVSMFVRPNFGIAVVWLGITYAWASVRQRAIVPLLAFGLGLALALWMPFHNWHYGHEFRLVSKPGSTISTTLGPRDYVTAAKDLVAGRSGTAALAGTSTQLRGWLVDRGWVAVNVPAVRWTAQVVKLTGLLVCVGIALGSLARRFAGRPDLPIVAVAALCAHAPMPFIFNPDFRYACLAWDLSLIVLIVWLSRLRHGAPAPAAPVVHAG